MRIFSIIALTPLLATAFFRQPIRPHRPSIIHCSDKNYPFSRKYYENYLKRLNSKNITLQNQEISGNEDIYMYNKEPQRIPIRIIINKNSLNPFGFEPQENENDGDDDEDEDDRYRKMRMPKSKRSENFEVVEKTPLTFADVGGYETIKSELCQCLDMLKNHTKYAKYNVRVPKGLIFEGPPGNGKTLLAKAFAGESGCGFIAVSGAEFQEKYVGVGSSRIRELFQLAKKNIPCIIFIDEIDALGRSRGKDGETASAERDNTLNELLVALDGFKNTTGIFVIGATNRADLLDHALMRPGRIDKRIFIGNPDEKTRRQIIKIHLAGKPHIEEITEDGLVEMTAGFSGAQIENFLNEAMLNALRYDREMFDSKDLEVVSNKMLVGWQPTEHVFTDNLIDHIAIHEVGHAIVGILSKHHSKVKKIVINLSAPNSPGYTVFESPLSNLFTREALFEHLTILLAGRIAEEVFYGVSVTTGAINDFEEAHKLAQRMVVYYGMGHTMIYPMNSDKYKEMVDDEIVALLEQATIITRFIIERSREFIEDAANLLKEKRAINADELIDMMNLKYGDIFEYTPGGVKREE